jgi:cleavage and polyadenylation specificity factor subunit 1
MGVRLLQGVEQVQHIHLDLGSPIVHASCADPHMVLLSEDGQVILLTLKDSRVQGRLSVIRPTLILVSKNYVALPPVHLHSCITEI